MDRRDLLKLALSTGFATLLPKMVFAAPTIKGNRFGWDENASKRSVEQFIAAHEYPFLSQQDAAIRGTGEGKTVLLWKCLERAMGTQFVPHDQEIGDCVGHGFGLAVDTLTAAQIEMGGMPEKWVAKAATEILYAGGRIEVGKLSRREAMSDGSTGHWQSEFLTNWGVLLRQAYPGGFDFTNYSGATAKKLGATGVPDALELLCKLHPVKTCALARSYEECRDSIANGYPVAMCCNIGFGDSSSQWVRDSEGFLTRKRAPWYHCQAVLGVDDNPRRPGCLVFNSWGSRWVTGPTRLEQPLGTYWVDASTIDAAMKQGDSMALSNYVGYPGLSVPSYVIWQPRP